MERHTKLFLELGRLRGTETPQNTSAPNDEDHYKTQYLRLPADYSEKSSLEVVENLCMLASESQCFYRSISLKQWLRTVISKDQETDDPIIHSNVVSRQAYLDAPCLDPHHCRGFSPASEVTAYPRSCKNCALAQHMRDELIDRMAVDQLNTLLLIEEEVKDVQDLAQGAVHKILWRSGTFVRKRFNCRGIFERELEVVTEVSHPNIVHCFGWSWTKSDDSQDDFEDGSEDDSEDDSWNCDLFMEYLDVDLQRFLNEEGEGSGSPFSFRDSLDVLLQVAEAMKHLQDKNFLHGDLKPQNIFMSRFDLAHSGVQYYLVKVGDFGCAQRVDSSGATVEPFCPGIGTTCYTAPEVFRCRLKIAPPPKHPQKIDVYSFGVVAYQVLTGVANLYVGCRNSRTIAEEVIRGLRPNSDFKGTLDGDRSSMLTYIKRCWSDNPEERPSFSQICDELSRRSNDFGLWGNIAKRKHHDSIGEGSNFVKLTKTACEQTLYDQNESCIQTCKASGLPIVTKKGHYRRASVQLHMSAMIQRTPSRSFGSKWDDNSSSMLDFCNVALNVYLIWIWSSFLTFSKFCSGFQNAIGFQSSHCTMS